jgi:hypothetical protein
MRTWQPVTSDELYVVLHLIMLMGIMQKPILKSYFSRDPFVETPVFPHTMTRNTFKLITKFLHFVDNNILDTYTGTKKNFQNSSPPENAKKNFQSAYLPTQDISVDKSLTLEKGHLSFKQYILLKAVKFGIKTFKLCESSSEYLWNFFVCIGAGSDITTGTDVPDSLQSSKIVVRLVEPLVKLGRLKELEAPKSQDLNASGSTT